MARSPRIRIRNIDRSEYARLVRNARAKIRRTQKKYGLDLSNAIELPPLESFKTRKEFNKWKQTVSSFTNRNNLRFQFKKNPYGVVASKAELAEIERKNRIAIQNAKRELKRIEKLPVYLRGEKIATVGQRAQLMANPAREHGISVPNKFDFSKIRTKYDLERVKRMMEKKAEREYYHRRRTIMQQNYIDMLEKSFNSDADQIVELVKQMSPDEFYEMYLQEVNLDFDLFYSADGSEDDDRLPNLIKTTIEKYMKRNKNDLSGF